MGSYEPLCTSHDHSEIGIRDPCHSEQSPSFYHHSGCFWQDSLPHSTSIGTLKKIWTTNHNTYTISDEDAEYVLKTTDLEEIKGFVGVDLLTIRRNGGIKDKFFYNEKPKISKTDPDMEMFLQVLNGMSCMLTVCRRSFDAIPALNQYMKGRFEEAAVKGVLHMVNEFIGIDEGRLFDVWQEKPNKPLPRPQHMKMKDRKHTMKYAIYTS